MENNDKVMWVRIASVAGAILVLAIAAPLILSAAAAGAGLLVIGAMSLVAFAVYQALPLMGQKLENSLLAARKQEARENPIEQHQNSARRTAQKINDYRQATTTIKAQIEGMKDMVRTQRKKDPNYDFERSELGIKTMEAAYAKRLTTIANSEKKLAEFQLEIEREIFEWEMALATRSTKGLLSPQDEANIMDGILNNEASRSVREQFNMACAELDMEVRTLNNTEQLTFDGGLTLDVSSIRINEQVPVRN